MALAQAGPNAAELQVVLSHYASDPERLEAAKRLIANMPLYYSYDTPLLDSVEADLAPLMLKKMNFSLSPQDKEKWAAVDWSRAPKRPDVEAVSADYLISNIDMAFDEWKGRKWNASLSFGDFCELLLPYRIGDERLTPWRQLYLDHYGPLLDSAYQGDDALAACRALAQIIESQDRNIFNNDLRSPHRDAVSLFANRVGYCRDQCDVLTYAMRACGIPVTSDHLLVAPQNGASHQWMVVRDNATGRFIPFGYDGMVASRDTFPDDKRPKGKVHRQQFFGKKMADVTAQYFGENKAVVDIAPGMKDVWLGMLTRGQYIVIAKGEAKGRRAIFNNIEPGLFYIPLARENGAYKPCGHAFTIADGEVRAFAPDTTLMTSVEITRKMPLVDRHLQWMGPDVVGAVIEASTDHAFSRPDTLVRVAEPFASNRNVFQANGTKPYAAIRYSVSKGKRLHLAELSVFADTLMTQRGQLRIATAFDPQFGPEYLIDGDILTNFTGPDGVNSVTLQLVQPMPISAIMIVSHNDDNFVWPGQNYELLCLDGERGWRSLGRRTAATSSLTYDVPANALLWLRNLDKGTEEQPFIIQSSSQVWRLPL